MEWMFNTVGVDVGKMGQGIFYLTLNGESDFFQTLEGGGYFLFIPQLSFFSLLLNISVEYWEFHTYATNQ